MHLTTCLRIDARRLTNGKIIDTHRSDIHQSAQEIAVGARRRRRRLPLCRPAAAGRHWAAPVATGPGRSPLGRAGRHWAAPVATGPPRSPLGRAGLGPRTRATTPRGGYGSLVSALVPVPKVSKNPAKWMRCSVYYIFGYSCSGHPWTSSSSCGSSRQFCCDHISVDSYELAPTPPTRV